MDAPIADHTMRVSRQDRLRTGCLLLSATLVLCLCVIYALRPDGLAALTIWPTWAWLLPGALLTTFGLRRQRTRWGGLVLVGWLLFIVLFVEEAGSLLHTHRWPDPAFDRLRQERRALRVISLNCAGGQAAMDVVPYRPDIVLLQESPGLQELDAVRARLFGAEGTVLAGPDASIIARGQLIASPPSLPSDRLLYVSAFIRVAPGVEVEVISLRLLPPVIRTDLWFPSCWRAHLENRRARRAEATRIWQRAALTPASTPLIVGGDFNAPAGDAIFRGAPGLFDSFRRAGMGWGDTITDDLPVQRIDQIWVSAHFRPRAVVARPAAHSDHRMVICDLEVRPPHSTPHPTGGRR